jgi:hypothetical protein
MVAYTHRLLLKMLQLNTELTSQILFCRYMNKQFIFYYSVFQVDEAYNLRLNTTKSTSKLVYYKKNEQQIHDEDN